MATVLIVERYPDLLEVLADGLVAKQWDVATASSVGEAVRMAEGVRVDVVLVDEVLPDGAGSAVEEAFRRDDRLKAVPFVYMTDAAGARRAPADRRAITRPCTLNEVVEAVAGALAAARR